MTLREQLHQQIDRLPDDILQLIADFMFFVMARRFPSVYTEWGNKQWQDFTLEQFFHEEDEVEYSLAEAKEVYHP